MKTETRASIDWEALRSLDIAIVATRLLGPSQGRKGESPGRLWWHCPLHDDRNPSFTVNPGTRYWKCFGCGQHGDAIDLVAKVEGMPKIEAARFLLGDTVPSHRHSPSTERQQRPHPELLKGPSDAWRMRALAYVVECEKTLWEPVGRQTLAQLEGRGLSHETIRAARLGFNPHYREDGLASGIVIPWFDGMSPIMVQVRRPDGSNPKYLALKGGYRAGIYPSLSAIQSELPLVIAEGELDCLLLAQELNGLASVITLGSASEGPSIELLLALLPVTRRYIATDADTAGELSASRWLDSARCRRVRPPGQFKGWTDLYLWGVNLRRWWQDLLSGDERPALFTWDELSRWRWGPALLDDDTVEVLD